MNQLLNKLLILAHKKSQPRESKDSRDKDSRDTDILAILRNMVFFVAVHLYFTGWIYNFYLYQHFGINLSSLDIPFYYFFVYAFTVIYLNVRWFTVIALGLIVMVVLVERYKPLKKWVVPLILVALFPVTFYVAKNSAQSQSLEIRRGKGITRTIVFILKDKGESPRAGGDKDEASTVEGGAGSVEKDVESGTKDVESGTKEVAPKEASDKLAKGTDRNDGAPGEYQAEFLQANKTESLRLLIQTKDKYYVFYQPSGEEEGSTGIGELDIGYTYAVLNSDVKLATIIVP